MPVRNLTERDEYPSDGSSVLRGDYNSRPANPFLASDEENEDGSATSFIHYDDRNGNLIDMDDDDQRDGGLGIKSSNAHVSDYKGYYSKNNSTAQNIGGASGSKNLDNSKRYFSQTSLNTGLSKNDILSPPEFDRYPLVGSRVASMTQLNHQAYSSSPVPRMASSPDNSGSSLSSTNNNTFLGEQDFSPFGGYPASSFPLLMEEKEDDDYLHNPVPEEEAMLDRKRFVNDFKYMDKKSFGGLVGIVLLFLGAGALFVVLPALTYSGVTSQGKPVVQTLLSAYQYPQLSAIRTKLVDFDTPQSAYSRQARDGSYWKLVFSDEFNAEGRTFYDGEDQFWTAPDIHYDATKDLEWYSPDASTTRNGTLTLRMDAFQNHGLFYRSGMLQSWNKLCFTQGALEISANLPNYGRVSGLWPGLWTMGNLGRPGYLGSTDGVWPYSYSSCDAGITPNQSSPDGISYLPGQRLSVCTCDGEEHPNQGVGRGAPEIDVLEGATDTTLGTGVASQSYQVAPFDIWYMPDYTFIEVHNFSTTSMNTYCGGPFQQAISAVTTLNTSWYQFGENSGHFQKFAIEFLHDDDEGYIQWYVGDNPTWTLTSVAIHPNGNIGQRHVSKEPMSMILNLGLSNNWAYIDWQMIYFPVTMSIDYVRIYQPNNSVSITCDPSDYPTYDYIESHPIVYQNPNVTKWALANYSTPKNILTGNCKSSKFSLKNN